MIANSRSQLEALCAPDMTYGHSSGRVQTRKEFIDEASSGKSTWKSITLSEQKVSAAGTTGWARFIFSGDLESEGKTNSVHFGCLMVWVSEGGRWRLFARQGYKI
jgi:hypothetical protein